MTIPLQQMADEESWWRDHHRMERGWFCPRHVAIRLDEGWVTEGEPIEFEGDDECDDCKREREADSLGGA